MKRFEVHQITAYAIFDNHKQDYWREGGTIETWMNREKAEKYTADMNMLIDNMMNFKPNAGLGRPRKR